MDHLLFCVNHQEKVAKRHCNKCDQNLCNECVFESHVEHHSEVTKIEYSIDTKQANFNQYLSKEIKTIIEKALNDLKPKIYHLVLDKTEEYLKGHNNLNLKLNQTKEIKKEQKIPAKHLTQNTEKEDISKNQNKIKTSPSKISDRAKKFSSINNSEVPRKIDENNPINKTKKLGGGIKERSKMFEVKY